MSGEWVVDDGEPFWQWTFASGWKEKVQAIDVAFMSTTQSTWEMFLAETVVKLQLIYDQLGLPKPEEAVLIRKVELYLTPWATGGSGSCNPVVPSGHGFADCVGMGVFDTSLPINQVPEQLVPTAFCPTVPSVHDGCEDCPSANMVAADVPVGAVPEPFSHNISAEPFSHNISAASGFIEQLPCPGGIGSFDPSLPMNHGLPGHQMPPALCPTVSSVHDGFPDCPSANMLVADMPVGSVPEPFAHNICAAPGFTEQLPCPGGSGYAGCADAFMGFVAPGNGVQVPAATGSLGSNMCFDFQEPLPCPGGSGTFDSALSSEQNCIAGVAGFAGCAGAYMGVVAPEDMVQAEPLSSHMLSSSGFEGSLTEPALPSDYSLPGCTDYHMEHAALHDASPLQFEQGFPESMLHADHSPLPSGMCLGASELGLPMQHIEPGMLPSASQGHPAFPVMEGEANANSIPAPYVDPSASMPFEVHAFLSDNAVACIPGASSSEASLQETNDAQACASSMVKVPTVVPASTPKTISIIKPFDEAALQVRPAIVRIDRGQVLAATVEQSSRVVEWEWSRAAAAIGLKTDKNSQFLKRNRDQHYSELIHAEISQDQLMYRGVGSGARGQHGMGSSAFMLVILLVSLTKQHTPDIKAAALRLAVDLLKVAVATMSTAVACVGIVYGKDKRYHEQSLQIDSLSSL
eukprot:s1613_g5.t1